MTEDAWEPLANDLTKLIDNRRSATKLNTFIKKYASKGNWKKLAQGIGEKGGEVAWARAQALQSRLKSHLDRSPEVNEAIKDYQRVKVVKGILTFFQTEMVLARDAFNILGGQAAISRVLSTEYSWSAPNCYLLVASAGSGKTNLLSNLSQNLAHTRPLVFLLGGNIYIEQAARVLGVIQSELEEANANVTFRSPSECLHALHLAAEHFGKDAVIIIDAFNECNQSAQMLKAIEDLVNKTRGKRIKLILSCRDFYWGLFKAGSFWRDSTVNELPLEIDSVTGIDPKDKFNQFAVDEGKRALLLYLEYFNIRGEPGRNVIEQCRHPLLLRFFCEAYEGQNVSEVESIRLKELFDLYWTRKLESIAERMIKDGNELLQKGIIENLGNYLLQIAAYMLHNNMRTIFLTEIVHAVGFVEQYYDPRSIYGRIRDEYIILEEKEQGQGSNKIRQVTFVYEEFMEYVMALSLRNAWGEMCLDNKFILNKIDELTSKYDSFAQIIGVIVYLSLMLRKEYGVALWPMLVKRGERWQRVIFETVRKLSEEQLDPDIVDVLLEIAGIGGNKSIQSQAIETLTEENVERIAPKSVFMFLVRLANHQNEQIAHQAVVALGKAPTDLSASMVPVLRNALGDTRESVRKSAARSLAMQEGVDIKIILTALKNRNWRMRVGATEVLGLLKRVEGVQPLITMLGDQRPEVREAAVTGLAMIEDDRVAYSLAEVALKDSNPQVRKKAALVFRNLNNTSLEIFSTFLETPNKQLRKKVLETLEFISTTKALAMMREYDDL